MNLHFKFPQYIEFTELVLSRCFVGFPFVRVSICYLNSQFSAKNLLYKIKNKAPLGN